MDAPLNSIDFVLSIFKVYRSLSLNKNSLHLLFSQDKC